MAGSFVPFEKVAYLGEMQPLKGLMALEPKWLSWQVRLRVTCLRVVLIIHQVNPAFANSQSCLFCFDALKSSTNNISQHTHQFMHKAAVMIGKRRTPPLSVRKLPAPPA
jgi:hypothetical protein